MFQTKYFLYNLLICIIIRTSVAAPPPETHAVINAPVISDSKAPQQKLENENHAEPPAKPNPGNNVKNDKVVETKDILPVPPKEETKTKNNKNDTIVAQKFLWKELRNNATLTQRFNQTLLNETIVPFLKKCDSVDDKLGSLDPADKRNLCPVFYDNLMRLNSTATSINSTELDEFVRTANKNPKFCEEIFLKNVLNHSTYYNYTKALFTSQMERGCFNLCYENLNDDLPKDTTCAIIAFMGNLTRPRSVQSEVETNKKTDPEYSLPAKEVDEEPSQNNDEEDYPDSGGIKNNDVDEAISPSEKHHIEEENKQRLGTSAQQGTEIVSDDHLGSSSSNHPISPNIVIDEPDPSSMKYFALATLILCVVYFGWHYRSKILGLIVEGRRSQRGRGGGRGRKHTAAYRKLDSNLEEAINSSTSSRSNSQIIY